ncbi:MAG: hypothetical protein FJ368_00925 [Pelagibacterales bacterium]|nr:hypothetical protein [Pelagibacterales bacterium]
MENSGFFEKIKLSFKASLKGEENPKVLIYYWGLVSWFTAFFVIDKIIKINDIRVIDVSVSILTIIYFVWHIYVLKKCSPKKPKLTKEEKKKLKEEARKEIGKKLLRKLFLQEPIRKWDLIFVSMVFDAFCIAQFLGYISK